MKKGAWSLLEELEWSEALQKKRVLESLLEFELHEDENSQLVDQARDG